MTQWPLFSMRLAAAVFAGVLCALPAAHAWQATPRQAAPRPRGVVIQPSVSQQRFQQAVQQNQVNSQLRQNQVESQLRQQSMEMSRRPAGSTTSNDAQVDNARQAQQRLDDARQRDQVQRYNDAITPQPAPRVVTPAPAKPAISSGR